VANVIENRGEREVKKKENHERMRRGIFSRRRKEVSRAEK